MVRLPRNEKQTYRLISRPQMWPSGLTLAMTLTLNFQGEMRNWLYLPKMVWLPRNEKQTHQLNSRRQMWPSDLTLAMTLTLNFQGQIWNLLYLNQKWSDCHETKSKHIDLNSRPQCDNGFDLGHDIDIWIFKVICDLDHLVTKVRCNDLPDSDRGHFRCWRAVNSSSCRWPVSYLLPGHLRPSWWFRLCVACQDCIKFVLHILSFSFEKLLWDICIPY